MAINFFNDFANLLPSIIDGVDGLMKAGRGNDLASKGAAYAAQNFNSAAGLSLTGSQYKADTLRRAGDMAMSGAAYEKKIIENAKKISTQGAEYQAASLVNAGSAAISAARYNIGLDEIDTDRTLSSMGRSIKSAFSTNNAIISGTGTSVTSKSYLAAMDDALSKYENETNIVRSTALLRQQQIAREGELTAKSYLDSANAAVYAGKLASYNFDNEIAASDYQARIAQYNYNNQAVAAEYEGRVDAWRYSLQARQAEYEGRLAQYQSGLSQARSIGGLIGKLGSLF